MHSGDFLIFFKLTILVAKVQRKRSLVKTNKIGCSKYLPSMKVGVVVRAALAFAQFDGRQSEGCAQHSRGLFKLDTPAANVFATGSSAAVVSFA